MSNAVSLPKWASRASGGPHWRRSPGCYRLPARPHPGRVRDLDAVHGCGDGDPWRGQRVLNLAVLVVVAVLVALMALVATVCAVAIRLTAPGLVLFRQERIALGAVLFLW